MVQSILVKKFQLTRSVGSVTNAVDVLGGTYVISTHTLRGERDSPPNSESAEDEDFNSHAPWGA